MNVYRKIFLLFLVFIVGFSVLRTSSALSIPYDNFYIKYEGNYGSEPIYLTWNYNYLKTGMFNFSVTGNGTFSGIMTGITFIENRTMFNISSSMSLVFLNRTFEPIFLVSPVEYGNHINITENGTKGIIYEVIGTSQLNFMGKVFKCLTLFNDSISNTMYFDSETLVLLRLIWNISNIYLDIHIVEWSEVSAPPFVLDPIWWAVIIGGGLVLVLGIGNTLRKRVAKTKPIKKVRKLSMERIGKKPSPFSKVIPSLTKLWQSKIFRTIFIISIIVITGFIIVIVYMQMGTGSEWIPRRFGMHDLSNINLIDGDVESLYYTDKDCAIYSGSDTVLRIWVEISYIDIFRDYDFNLVLNYTGFSYNRIKSINVYVHNSSSPWFGFIGTECYRYHYTTDGYIDNKSIYTMTFNMRTDYLHIPTTPGTFDSRYDTLSDGGHSFTFLIDFRFISSGQSYLKIDQCVLLDQGKTDNPFA